MSYPQTRRSPAATGLRDRTTNSTRSHGRPIDRVLPLLHGVRKSGHNHVVADCPNGHTKTRGSLSITEADDGRVLMNCFACQDTPGILAAVGLQMADLFPERIKDASPEARRTAREAFKRSGWTAALGVLARESTVVEVAAHDLANGKALSIADHERLLAACDRIHGAREVLA